MFHGIGLTLAVLCFLALPSFAAGSDPASVVADLDLHPLRPSDTSSPRDTLNSFLTQLDRAIDAWETGQPLDVRTRIFDRAAETLDVSQLPESDLRASTLKAALQLKEVLDRIAIPPADDIPGDDDLVAAAGGQPLASWTIPDTAITIARVDEGPRAGDYLFTAETIAHLGQYYEEVQHLPYKPGAARGIYDAFIHSPGPIVPTSWALAMPSWLRMIVLGEALWQWLTLLLALAAALVLIRWFLTLGWRWDIRQRDGAASRRFGMPLAILGGIVVLFLARFVLVYGAKLVGGPWTIMSSVFWVLMFVGSGWFVFLTASRAADVINDARKVKQSSIDAQLLRTLLRLLSILILAYLVLYAADFFGIPVTPVLASLGVGGLAIALAVRPTLENVVGGLTLFADKPVRIGDFCRFGDDYGTVEEIGLRSTRLRKLDDTLVSVPNADFSQRELTNYTRRRQRLYRTTLGLRYETTPGQLRYVIAGLEKMLSEHPKVLPRWRQVRFTEFGPYSLDIEIFAYVGTPDWLEYRAIQEDLNFRVMAIVRDAGTGFAFPSQTAYLGRDTGLDEERARAVEAAAEE